MSFLLRARSLLTQLPRLTSTYAPLHRRGVTLWQHPKSVSGYGANTNNQQQPQQQGGGGLQQQSAFDQPKPQSLFDAESRRATKNAREVDNAIQGAEEMREMATNSDGGQESIDGGRLPNYSGPSIA